MGGRRRICDSPRLSYGPRPLDEPDATPGGFGDARKARWLADRFGKDRVEAWGKGISYPTRGGLDQWCQATFPNRIYDFLCAEFGTDSGLQVLGALRAENQPYHWGKPDSQSTRQTKKRLVEAFAPSDPQWRSSTLDQGRATVRRAFEVAFQSSVFVSMTSRTLPRSQEFFVGAR